jgi:hypothetical protein
MKGDSAPWVTVLGVFDVIHGPEMVGVDASAYTAGVVDFGVLRDRPMGKFVGDSMSEVDRSHGVKTAISVAVFVSIPYEAVAVAVLREVRERVGNRHPARSVIGLANRIAVPLPPLVVLSA